MCAVQPPAGSLCVPLRRPCQPPLAVLLLIAVAAFAPRVSAQSISVTPTTLTTTEGGGAATFAVSLTSAPTGDVTVTVASSNPAEVSLDKSQLVFTTGNFGATQQVIASGVSDSIDDGDQTSTISTTAASADAQYNGKTGPAVTVTNTDDDTADISVATSGTTTTESGTTQTIDVKLTSEPAGGNTVAIACTVSDATEGECSPTSVTFTQTSWNVAQKITVRGPNDNIADGNVAYILTLTASSSDPAYSGKTKTEGFTNNDDDAAGFSFFPAAGTVGLTTHEDGSGKVSLRLRLTSEPTDTVTVNVQSKNTAEGVLDVSSVQFHPSDWQSFKSVVVTGVDDQIDDGDVSFNVEFTSSASNDANYVKTSVIETFSLTNIDDDTASITLSPTTFNIEEAKPAIEDHKVTIKLNTQPTADVTVNVASSDASEVLVHRVGGTPATNLQVVIAVANWQTAETVVISAVDDDEDDGDQTTSVTVTTASGDSKYTTTLTPLVVKNIDDDTAGIELCTTIVPLSSPCAFTAGTVDERGASTPLYMRLRSRPASVVTATPTSSNAAEVVAAPVLTFAIGAWNVFQKVTVTGVADGLDDGDQSGTISFTFASSDALYAAVSAPNFLVTVTDTDVDECAATSPKACNYKCTDPNIDDQSLLDFTCECPPPSKGATTTGKDTLCTIEECELYASTCTNHLQSCRDPDTGYQSTGDWVCQCDAPASGPDAVAGPTACIMDECAWGKCGAFQQCNDMNISQHSTGDWFCNCTTGVGWANQKGAVCVLDECIANMCDDFQTCTDPNTDPASLHDWECQCNAPYVGRATASRALCVLDECTLANNTAVCAGVRMQVCRDNNTSPTAREDWGCECADPAYGTSGVAGPGTCFYNECAANANVCLANVLRANGGHAGGKGDGIGHGYAQACIDRNISTEAYWDWECECTAPATGTSVASAANCTLNECHVAANNATCVQANQTCVDSNTVNSDLSSADDWHCECRFPSRGAITLRSPAICTLDECWYQGSVCTAVQQSCVDTDVSTTSTDTWGCNCSTPSVGFSLGGPAACTLDECAFQGVVCTNVGQVCNDTNTSALSRGDWQCLCPAPLQGVMTEGTAVCVMDECAPRPCGANQTCIDPVKTEESRNDFLCECTFPLLGPTVTNGPTTCRSDECVMNNATCTDRGQRCVDPSESDGDWGCDCVAPYTGGRGARAAAMCTYDECTAGASVCGTDQDCSDTNTSISNTWVCQCRTPYTGADGMRAPASCVLDECSVAATRKACDDAAQDCVDPNTAKAGDWACWCRAPLQGTATAAPAVCTKNGCESGSCGTTQTCVVVGTRWRCECPPPSRGVQYGGPATCIIDKCTPEQKALCAQHGQQCTTQTQAQWACVCTAPATGGPQPAGPAVCSLDECDGNTVCAQAGQTCVDDKIPGNLRNWQCQCGAPATGSATANVAVCALNECAGNAACGNEGQRCEDPTPTADRQGDWLCRCANSNRSNTGGPVADCQLKGECADPAVHSTCESLGQVCEDSNSGATGDWQCVCVGGLTGRATAASAACVNTTLLNAGKNATPPNDDSGFDWLYVIIPLALVVILGALIACVYRTQRDIDNPPPSASKSLPDSPQSASSTGYKPMNSDMGSTPTSVGRNPVSRPAPSDAGGANLHPDSGNLYRTDRTGRKVSIATTPTEGGGYSPKGAATLKGAPLLPTEAMPVDDDLELGLGRGGPVRSEIIRA